MNSPNLLRRFGLLASLGLFASLGLASRFTNTQAQLSPLGQSGEYIFMTVGISGSGDRITGYYESNTGWDDNLQTSAFSCIFYFSGERNGDRYQITSWYPGQEQDSTAGSLSFTNQNNKQALHLQLEENHGGCGNAHNFEGEGSQLFLSQAGHWTSVRTVANQRAYFHRQPSEATQTKSYVIAGDILKIYETRGDWVDAEFGSDRTTRGWVKLSDLHPAS